MRSILVVDDDRPSREALEDLLAVDGHRVRAAAEGEAALTLLDEESFDLVITDLVIPGASGLQVMERALERDAQQRVILVTGYGTVETAVEAMQKGAFHYLTKPVKPMELKALVARALEDRRLREENRELQRRLDEREGLAAIVGGAPALERTLELVRRAAPADSTVLVTGESGTGKELVASALHALSPRASRPLVKLNCAAIPRDLVESELFGHRKGAFTGATMDRKGRFERADGGTLFLDEVGEMSLETQARLLRVLESGEVEPIGGDGPVQVDVRVVAATNRDLEAGVERGEFRRDLYYRLKVVRVELPPLRERVEDIPLLVAHFLEDLETRMGRGVTGVEPRALELLKRHPWPGNVRELKNSLEEAVITADGPRIGIDDLPAEVRGGAAPAASGGFRVPPGMTVEDLEREAILQTLNRLGGGRTETAEALGISLRTLQRKLKQYREEGLVDDESGYSA